MTGELVTCIIPVFNGARYLEESLGTVLGQTWRPLEVIAVDDGSTDETPDILRRYSGAITVIRQENAGPVAARNRGMAAANGEFLAFNDADDLWVPDKLELQMACLSADPDLGFCAGHAQNFWEDELAEEATRFSNHARSKPIPAYTTTTLLVRRRVMDLVGSLDATLGHGDTADWLLRAERAGVKGRLLPHVLLYRRLHAGNRSRTAAAESRDEFLRLLKRKLDERRHRAGDDRPE